MFEKNKTAVIDSLLPREAFHSFPGFRERESWNALPVELADFLIRKGEGYLGYDWPVPLASMYMEFCRGMTRQNEETRRGEKTDVTQIKIKACCKSSLRQAFVMML